MASSGNGVVGYGARQWGFTVQNATVRPLPCVPTKNTRQEFAVRFKAFAVRSLFPVVNKGQHLISTLVMLLCKPTNDID
jgi:hypothetical protein